MEWQQLGGLNRKCDESAMEAGLATENTGTFHIGFEKCKSSSPAVTCTGKDGTVNDAPGTTLSFGTIKLVHDVTETGTTYAMLFEHSPDTEFGCTALAK
jgi:hypothetical protein